MGIVRGGVLWSNQYYIRIIDATGKKTKEENVAMQKIIITKSPLIKSFINSTRSNISLLYQLLVIIFLWQQQ